MRKRVKLKKIDKKKSICSPVLMIITLVIILAGLLIRQLSNTISPILLTYVKLRVEQLSNQVVNNAISNELLAELDIGEIFITVQNDEGQIISVDFNPIVVNKILNKASDVIQKNLKALERGEIRIIENYEDLFYGYDLEKLKKGIIYEIPLGVITNTALLNNVGPRIPIKFALVGSLNTNIGTTIKNYGINNIIMEVFIHIDLANQLIAPLMSERIIYQLDIPIITRILPGEVPRYYQSGISESSPILSVPIE